jgi:SAM-dependent methyltransferase
MSRSTGADADGLKEEGKRRATALLVEYDKAGRIMEWFDACYEQADGELALVPWAHETARPEFVEWLEALPPERRKGRALDVGCGLGDNAVRLAQAGFEVTAFDISPRAIEWARKRFPDATIEWRATDLTDPPEDFTSAFDLVNDTYALQALRSPHREMAIRPLARFVKPGGTLLIVGRGRHPDEPENPPPWPLVIEELKPLEDAGLDLVAFDDFYTERKGRPVRHHRLEYRRPGGRYQIFSKSPWRPRPSLKRVAP